MLNPKVALFFIAFLPQFVSEDNHHHALALLLLGLTFTLTSTLVNTTIALVTQRISYALEHVGNLGSWCKRVAGNLFVYLGIKLVMNP